MSKWKVLGLLALTATSAASAAVTIQTPTSESSFHQRNNTVVLAGTATGDVGSVSWDCESGCNQAGTARGTADWRVDDTLYVDNGSNIITVTAHHRDGSTSSDTIEVYRTNARRIDISFPYSLDFDSGPETLDGRYTANWEDGARVTHETDSCWRGGCAKFVPSHLDNTYAGLSGFQLPENTQRVHIRYLIKFGPDFVRNLDHRMKHLLIHRDTAYSHDRGMLYIWNTMDGRDLSLGACDNTTCSFGGGGGRPQGDEAFLIGEHLNEWVAFEAVFDTAENVAKVYVTTPDGSLNQHLLAEQPIDDVAASEDYWSRVGIIGGFIDLGTTPSDGMYWMIDELAMDDEMIGPPDGFVRGATQSRPSAPRLFIPN